MGWADIRMRRRSHLVWIVLWTHMLAPRHPPHAEAVPLGEVHRRAPLCAAAVGQAWLRWLPLILLSVRSSLAQNAQQECMLLLVIQVARVVSRGIIVFLRVLAIVMLVGKADILRIRARLQQALVWHVQQANTHLPWQWTQLMDVMCVRQGFTQPKMLHRAVLPAWHAARASIVIVERHHARIVWLVSTMLNHLRALA